MDSIRHLRCPVVSDSEKLADPLNPLSCKEQLKQIRLAVTSLPTPWYWFMIYPIVHLYVPCPIGKQQGCLFKGAPDKSVEIGKKKKSSRMFGSLKLSISVLLFSTYICQVTWALNILIYPLLLCAHCWKITTIICFTFRRSLVYKVVRKKWEGPFPVS